MQGASAPATRSARAWTRPRRQARSLYQAGSDPASWAGFGDGLLASTQSLHPAFAPRDRLRLTVAATYVTARRRRTGSSLADVDDLSIASRGQRAEGRDVDVEFA